MKNSLIRRRRRVTGTVAAVADTTGPIVSALTIDDSTDPVGIAFDISEDANVYGIWTVDSEQTGITGADIIAGNLADGVTPAPLATGPISATDPSESFTADISTLDDGLVRLYVTAQDAAGNTAAPVVTSFTKDTTAPVISAVTVTAGDTELDVAWSTDTADGTARIVAVPNAATDPTPAEILAGQQSGGTAAPSASGSITVTASGAQSAVTLTGLTNGTAYDVYIAHEDTAPLSNIGTASDLNNTPAVASGVPQVTSIWTGTAGPLVSQDATIGATNAGDSIFIFCLSSSPTATFSAPNFEVYVTGSVYATTRMIILKWDGTGTRPNSTTVTVTASVGHTFNTMAMVASGGTVSAATLLEDTSAAITSTGPTFTAPANSLIFHIFYALEFVENPDFTAPTPVPTLGAFTSPQTEINLQFDRSGDRFAHIMTDEFVAGGTTAAATIARDNFGFTGQWISFAVSA